MGVRVRSAGGMVLGLGVQVGCEGEYRGCEGKECGVRWLRVV